MKQFHREVDLDAPSDAPAVLRHVEVVGRAALVTVVVEDDGSDAAAVGARETGVSSVLLDVYLLVERRLPAPQDVSILVRDAGVERDAQVGYGLVSFMLPPTLRYYELEYPHTYFLPNRL